MNIGIISHTASEKSGARAPIELAKAIKRKGHKVTFYAVARGKSQDALGDLKMNGVNVSLIINNGFSEMPELYFKLKSANYDLLITQTPLPLYLSARLTGIPIIHYYHGTQFNIFYERAFPNYNLFFKALDLLFNVFIWLKTSVPIHASNYTVALSKYCSKESQKLYFKKIPTIYLGAISKHLQSKRKNNLRKRAKAITCLTVSRLTPYKNFHQLIDVIDKLNRQNFNLKLMIAGSTPTGRYLNYLNQKNSNSNVIVNPNDKILKKLYENSQIYLSADKYLFFGMPILEAAAFGIPSISLNFAAANEVIKNNKTGFVVNSTSEMEVKIIQLIQNMKTYKKLSINAQNYAKSFNWDKTANEFEKLFQQILG